MKQKIKEYLFGKVQMEDYNFPLDKHGCGTINYSTEGLFQRLRSSIIKFLAGGNPVIFNVDITLSAVKGGSQTVFALSNSIVADSSFNFETDNIKIRFANINASDSGCWYNNK